MTIQAPTLKNSHDASAWAATLPTGYPNGDTVVFPKGTTINCDAGPVVLKQKSFLKFDFSGVLFVQSTDGTETAHPRERCVLSLDHCVVTEVFGGIVKGANAHGGMGDAAYVSALEAQHGIWINGGYVIEAHDFDISYVYGDIVYVAGDTSPDKIHVHNILGHHQGRQGVSLCRGTNLLVEDCNLHDIRRSMFDLEPPAKNWTVDGAIIRRTTIGTHRLNFVAGHGRGLVNNVEISDNAVPTGGTAHLNSDFAAAITDSGRRHNLKFLRNKGGGVWGTSSGSVIKVSGYDNVDAEDNVQIGDNRIVRFVGGGNNTNVTDLNNKIH